MAFKDYMIKYPTLGEVVNGFVGNNIDDHYRTKIGQFFEQSVTGTLVLVAFLALYGVDLGDLRLTALLVFTSSYCIKNLGWFLTDVGMDYACDRFNLSVKGDGIDETIRGSELTDAGRAKVRSYLIWGVGPAMAGLVGILLLPAFFWGLGGLLLSTFLIAGSPAIIWWRFGDTRKKG